MRLALALFYDLMLVLVCILAVVRGGRPERQGALICLAGSALSSAGRLAGIASWAPAAWFVLAVDAFVALGFFWLATTTIRFWPVWAFGFALADIFVNIAAVIFPSFKPLAYQSMLGVYAYLALFVIGLASVKLPSSASAALRRGDRSSFLETGEEIDPTQRPGTPNGEGDHRASLQN